ncbi:MAG: hypothetical protein O3A88_06740, partial [Proteobacteria bacterium]|nr:hypothetical protein [Pseudomonadota bacterium]
MPRASAARTSARASGWRLAFADRDAYVADPLAMTLTQNHLLDQCYLAQRAPDLPRRKPRPRAAWHARPARRGAAAG